MKFRFKYADKIVGLFVIIALFFVCLMLILAGLNKNWFQKKIDYYTYFDSAEGLEINMPINMKGLEIGKIKKIIPIIEEGMPFQVRVEVEFLEEYISLVRTNSVLELKSNFLGFGGGMSFYPGVYDSESRILDEGSLIINTTMSEAKELISEGKVEKDKGDDLMSSLMDKVPIIVNSLSNSLTMVENALAGTSNEPLGIILKNIELLSYDINQLDNLLPTIIGDEGALADLFIDGSPFYNEFYEIVNGISVSINDINDLTGQLSDSSPQIEIALEELIISLEEAQDVMEGLKNNPLLRDGISEETITEGTEESTQSSYRDEDF